MEGTTGWQGASAGAGTGAGGGQNLARAAPITVSDRAAVTRRCLPKLRIRPPLATEVGAPGEESGASIRGAQELVEVHARHREVRCPQVIHKDAETPQPWRHEE